MPQGLQVFGENGKLLLDVTDRLTRVLGEFETGTTDGSITDPDLLSGTPWYVTYFIDSMDLAYKRPLHVKFTGNVLNWEWGIKTSSKDVCINTKIIYGVF